MEQAKVAEAARMLVEARRTGRRIAELPRDCKPATAADANQIIDAISEALDEAVAGWKITFLYKPREKPFRCPLFASRVFASPAQIPQSLTPSLCIEPEVTFRATRDLPPRAAVYRAEEVAAAVEACPSFEVVDTRFDTSNRTIRQMLNERASLIEAYADHITSGAFIVGPPLQDWRDIDFARMRVTMRKDDTPIVETDRRPCLHRSVPAGRRNGQRAAPWPRAEDRADRRHRLVQRVLPGRAWPAYHRGVRRPRTRGGDVRKVMSPPPIDRIDRLD